MGWHHKELQLRALWPKAGQGAGVSIAVLDSGVRSSSLVFPDGSIDRFDARGPVPRRPTHPHGTYCASLIASRKKGARGVAPKANILSVMVTLAGATPFEDWVVAGIREAIERGVGVISCSFTLPRLSAGLAQELQRAHQRGIVVVAAGGNKQHKSAPFPDRAEHVVVVGAHKRSRRPWLSRRITPRTDILAPGHDLRVVNMAGDRRTWRAETSGACAVAAGVVGVLLGSVPAGGRPALGRNMRALLKSTARTASIPARAGISSVRLIDPLAALARVKEG